MFTKVAQLPDYNRFVKVVGSVGFNQLDKVGRLGVLLRNDCGSLVRCGTPANLKGPWTVIITVHCS